MKNRLIKAAMVFGATFVGATSLTACGGKTNNANVLNIVCLKKGYGRAWIDELVKIWEEENPEYKVNLTAIAAADETIKKHIYDSDNIDDLYIGNSKDWKTYASSNKLLQLDDFMNETVDGMKIKDKVNDEYAKSIFFSGHTYRLPWTSGVPGIYYNSKMFEKYKTKWGSQTSVWDKIPETYEELVAICNEMVENPKRYKIVDEEPAVGGNLVRPFMLSDQLYYSDYAVFTWWAQLAGVEAVHEYLKYESADTFCGVVNNIPSGWTTNPTCQKLCDALKLWEDIFKNKLNYVEGSEGFSYDIAQQGFYNGQALMMFNSDWFYNEVSEYGPFGENFDIKLMKTPVAPGAIDVHASYIVGEDNYIAIPKSTIKADLAKSFIKLMISDRGIKIFAEKAHGTMAYKSTTTVTTEDPYTNSLIDYLANATHRFTNWSDSRMFLKNVLDIWSYKDIQPYSRIISKTAPITVDGSEERGYQDGYRYLLASNAKNKWAQWVREAGGTGN